MDFGPVEYIVKRIDGDYAVLVRSDIESEDEKVVARALLPAEIMEGSKLRYECLSYTLIYTDFIEKHRKMNHMLWRKKP